VQPRGEGFSAFECEDVGHGTSRIFQSLRGRAPKSLSGKLEELNWLFLGF
jgi:hypothetical protein